jgi:hypothetical protein
VSTTTIQLTDAQLAQFTASGLIVVDGDHFPAIPGFRQALPSVAPEFWRDLTDPCPTCGGNGLKLYPAMWEHEGPIAPCPDCVGGRQVVTLTATCPRFWPDEHDGPRCRRCKNLSIDHPAVYQLGRFTIRLLPVGNCERVHVGLEIDGPHVCPAEGAYPPMLCDESNGRKLELDPLPQPGQWAVKFEAVA